MATESDFNFPLTIKYTQRRGSVAFHVYPEGVKVFAPKGTTKKALDTLLAEKAEWLSTSWEQAQQKALEQPQRRLYQTGEDFPYLGLNYPLSIIKTDRRHAELDCGEICVDLPIDDTRDIDAQCEEVMREWLQQQAEAYLPPRLEYWVTETGWQPTSLKIRDYKSRWGSCDRHGRLTLNNRLMMAPPDVIDYVIIHELAHLKELNHSSRFWALVEMHCENFKKYRKWLKKHSAELQLSADI